MKTAQQTKNANDAISAAMKRQTKRCQECGRGQNPRIEFNIYLDKTPFWVCRYCEHVNRKAAR